jgi:hypothetical protein
MTHHLSVSKPKASCNQPQRRSDPQREYLYQYCINIPPKSSQVVVLPNCNC